MSHGSKQFLAWTTAFGLSTAIYGGGAYWLKNAGKAYLAQDDHFADDEHGAKPEHGDEHAAKSEHGNEHAAPAHAEEHAAKSVHGKEHAAPAHAEEHAAKSVHGKEHAAPAHAEEHAAKSEHSKEHAAPAHAQAANDPGTKHDAAKPADHAPHWTYGKSDAGGPSHWGDLAKNFSMCEKGMEQSPIDLRQATSSKDAPKITWHYGSAKLNVENNGHTIQSNLAGGDNHITIDGEIYSLAQFHFHSPSEHRISGVPADLELHFVHKNSSGGLAVVGVMINERAGKENKSFKPVWDIIPRDFNSKAAKTAELNLTSLIPAGRQYFHYKGSLTTPPCSEGVKWFVLKDPTTMSGGQLEMYSSIFGGPTNRPVQPIQGREIITNGTPVLAH